MEQATTRFSQTAVPPTAEGAREDIRTHQEEKRGLYYVSFALQLLNAIYIAVY